MLQGAADGLGANELDAVVVPQHADVVADDAERRAQLIGEVTGAGHALTETLEDLRAEGMGEGFGDAGLGGFPRGPAGI